MSQTPASPARPKQNLLTLLTPYSGLVALLVFFAVLGHAFSLAIPALIARGIDAYGSGNFDMRHQALLFALVAGGSFLCSYALGIVTVYVSERVARDLRTRTAAAISRWSVASVRRVTPDKLLTNLTSDADAVKSFVSQAFPAIISSLMLIVGASALLLWIDWRLALAVLGIIPVIGGLFYGVMRRVRSMFRKTQEVMDWLNRVINESILGAALVRVLHTSDCERGKFADANAEARAMGLTILRQFAAMIPAVTLISNAATMIILALGGGFVIGGSLTIGEFTAFNSYLMILIFPIFVIGFMSNVIARSGASFARIGEILDALPEERVGGLPGDIRGDVAVSGVSLAFGETVALKNVSFAIPSGSSLAIVGPTAAGKTQLLHLLAGLIPPDSGIVSYDGKPIMDYDPESLSRRIGLVFQDSILFRLSLRENIAFGGGVDEADLRKAIETAELTDFLSALPDGLETIVSERGTSLSGGQKQRVMLARALAINPQVLLLDDFTARVDVRTEARILENVRTQYPGITLLSVTQKIDAAKRFDKVMLLMEGEMLAFGTHEELMRSSPEYVQIERSQHSTHTYESANA